MGKGNGYLVKFGKIILKQMLHKGITVDCFSCYIYTDYRLSLSTCRRVTHLILQHICFRYCMHCLDNDKNLFKRACEALDKSHSEDEIEVVFFVFLFKLIGITARHQS